jgi:hypothetical protein
MGGQALMVGGELSPHRLEPSPPAPAPSLLHRLFRRALSPPPSVQVTSDGQGTRHFEVPPAELGAALPAAFKRWLGAVIGAPSEATAHALEYIDLVGPTVQVRGHQPAGSPAPSWYLQVSFSGCAGEAEVSARLGRHWAERWFKAKGDETASQILVPWGFRPEPLEPAVSATVFVEVPDVGYVECIPVERQVRGAGPFEVDAAAREAVTPEALRQAFDRLSRVAITACECQVCGVA